jgi:hypothetical protein
MSESGPGVACDMFAAIRAHVEFQRKRHGNSRRYANALKTHGTLVMKCKLLSSTCVGLRPSNQVASNTLEE